MKTADFLNDLLIEQYGEEIAEKIKRGLSKKRVLSLRVNKLKSNYIDIQNKLKEEKIEYEKVSWSEDAFVIPNIIEKEKIKSMDIYENGEIYLQSLSSMIPPIILAPKQSENILDMAAAPGSKTTQIAALSKNKSFITACEKNKIRAGRLKYNLEKQGVKNTYIMVEDARNMDDMFSFDKILLDAPCSGSGTININDENLEKKFNFELIKRSAKTQLNLMNKAIKLLKPGKEMIYSTCSILSCENEDIINKVLKNNNVEIVPIDFKGIQDIPKLPVKIEGTLCVAPNEYYEGFFIAKLRKNM